MGLTFWSWSATQKKERNTPLKTEQNNCLVINMNPPSLHQNQLDQVLGRSAGPLRAGYIKWTRGGDGDLADVVSLLEAASTQLPTPDVLCQLSPAHGVLVEVGWTLWKSQRQGQRSLLTVSHPLIPAQCAERWAASHLTKQDQAH